MADIQPAVAGVAGLIAGAILIIIDSTCSAEPRLAQTAIGGELAGAAPAGGALAVVAAVIGALADPGRAVAVAGAALAVG